MRRLVFVCVVAAQAGCVATPPLSDATGSTQSNIMIRDVVQRVKCELSEAFDQKMTEPKLRWLTSWTAHVDLTLTINGNAGLSPSGSFTRFEQNAVNQAAGPSTFPASAARAVVNQSFTVSVGATLSGQAIRTETVSFTVALDELKLWRERLDRLEAAPNFPPEKRLCNFGPGSGVTGNLGLQEWVDSAFFPAESDDLQAGIHSASAAKAASPSVASPGPVGPKSAAPLTVKEALDTIINWQIDLATLATDTKPASNLIDTGKTSVPAAQSSIRQKIKDAKPYKFVLAPYLKERYSRVSYLIDRYSEDLATCEDVQTLLQKKLAGANAEASRLYNSLKDLPVDQVVSQAFQRDYNALADQMTDFESDNQGKLAKIQNGKYAVAMSRCAKIVQEANGLPGKLPQQVDPPVDAVLHSLTFVISYGASVTPSWTLLEWKGPGQNPNFASASGVRTHNLVVSMGPRAGNPAIGDYPLRLIELQAIRSINQQ